MSNCGRPRCYVNGALNTGECECSAYQTNEKLLQKLEEGGLNGIPKHEVEYISKRLQLYTGQDRIFRLVNKMITTSK
jgi:hypothetical protein